MEPRISLVTLGTRDLARANAEFSGRKVQSPVQEVDEPQKGDEPQRELDRETEVVARPLGAGVGRVGNVDLHAVEIQSAHRGVVTGKSA